MARFNPEVHHRKSFRLSGHDYSSPGHYFVTICLDNIRCMLAIASFVNGRDPVGVRHGEPLRQKCPRQLQLTPVGNVAKEYWLKIPHHYPNVALDEFVVMPDHVHELFSNVVYD